MRACGLYGYRKPIKKISIGCRLGAKWQGKGIAGEALRLLIAYLESKTDIEIITASSLPENRASASLLRKNGFTLVVRDSPEDWGYEQPLPTDKWIR